MYLCMYIMHTYNWCIFLTFSSIQTSFLLLHLFGWYYFSLFLMNWQVLSYFHNLKFHTNIILHGFKFLLFYAGHFIHITVFFSKLKVNSLTLFTYFFKLYVWPLIVFLVYDLIICGILALSLCVCGFRIKAELDCCGIILNCPLFYVSLLWFTYLLGWMCSLVFKFFSTFLFNFCFFFISLNVDEQCSFTLSDLI